MLIHAMIHKLSTENLWLFTFLFAVDLHNHTPSTAGFTPEELFSGEIILINSLPSIFLAVSSLFLSLYFIRVINFQDGNHIAVRVNLGMSPDHNSSAPLVLSTTTGLVSPQFLVIFDGHFSTTQLLHTNSMPSNWFDLLNTSSISSVDGDFSATNLYDTTWFYTFSNSSNIHSSSIQREQTSPSRTNSSISTLQRGPSTPYRVNPPIPQESLYLLLLHEHFWTGTNIIITILTSKSVLLPI
jgi:hypothetical protein